MSSVDRGHAAERRWMKRLQEEGWFACRPRWAGVDVVAMKAGEPTYFDELKCNAGSPWMHFRSEDRILLSALAEKAGAVPRLVHWPARSEPRIYYEDDWPAVRQPKAA